MPILNRDRVYATDIWVSPTEFDRALAGEKTATVRLGTAHVPSDRLLLTDGERSKGIIIMFIDQDRHFGSLGDDVAAADGQPDVATLKNGLRGYYGELELEQPMTVIHFLTELDIS